MQGSSTFGLSGDNAYHSPTNYRKAPPMTFLFKILTALLALAILYLSLQPATGFVGPAYADKVQHFLAYGGLAFLAAFGWPQRTLLVIVVWVVGFGVGIEIAQGLGGQGRTLSALDALANTLGATVSATSVFYMRKWRRARSS